MEHSINSRSIRFTKTVCNQGFSYVYWFIGLSEGAENSMEKKIRVFCQINVQFHLSIQENNLGREVAPTIGYNGDTDFGFNF